MVEIAAGDSVTVAVCLGLVVADLRGAHAVTRSTGGDCEGI